MNVTLFGAESADIQPELEKYSEFVLVDEAPDVVVCYGGDGTLLAAEHEWPGVPKVPLRNSHRGKRMMGHPVKDVIQRLHEGSLIRTEYTKLECCLSRAKREVPPHLIVALNEINVHMARINSAVRFKMWIDDEPYMSGLEVLGDGFVISTPFGSTAYFNHITRGFFHEGIGVAFKSTSEHTNHVVVPENARIRILITRGPAVLTYDNSNEFIDLYEHDELTVARHAHPAVCLTWDSVRYPSHAF